MSNLTQNLYKIEDLYLVKFNENLKESLEFPFCKDTYYIVERTKIKDEFRYNEYYEECVTGIDFYSRSDYHEFNSIPSIFEFMETIPLEYLTEDELKNHTISSSRLFVIFQLINFPNLNKEKETSKVLKYGEKVC